MAAAARRPRGRATHSDRQGRCEVERRDRVVDLREQGEDAVLLHARARYQIAAGSTTLQVEPCFRLDGAQLAVSSRCTRSSSRCIGAPLVRLPERALGARQQRAHARLAQAQCRRELAIAVAFGPGAAAAGGPARRDGRSLHALAPLRPVPRAAARGRVRDPPGWPPPAQRSSSLRRRAAVDLVLRKRFMATVMSHASG